MTLPQDLRARIELGIRLLDADGLTASVVKLNAADMARAREAFRCPETGRPLCAPAYRKLPVRIAYTGKSAVLAKQPWRRAPWAVQAI